MTWFRVGLFFGLDTISIRVVLVHPHGVEEGDFFRHLWLLHSFPKPESRRLGIQRGYSLPTWEITRDGHWQTQCARRMHKEVALLTREL